MISQPIVPKITSDVLHTASGGWSRADAEDNPRGCPRLSRTVERSWNYNFDPVFANKWFGHQMIEKQLRLVGSLGSVLIAKPAHDRRNNADVNNAGMPWHPRHYEVTSFAIQTKLFHFVHQTPRADMAVVWDQSGGILKKVSVAYAAKSIDAKSNADEILFWHATSGSIQAGHVFMWRSQPDFVPTHKVLCID